MKKLVALLVLAVIGFAAWHLLRNDTELEPTVSLDTFIGRPDPSDATFYFEDGSVTLVKGVARESEPDSPLTSDIRLSKLSAFGDLNDDSKEDAAVILLERAGVSGLFVYVAGYVSGPVNHRGTNTVFIGDRIEVESLTLIDGVITIEYLSRGADEPLTAEPSIVTTRSFTVRDGTLIEK